MSQSDLNAEIGSVAVGDRLFGYRAEGSGLPCLAIGGAAFWAPTFSKGLRDHLRFVFADTRFLGPSSEPAEVESVTLDSLLAEVDAVRQAAGVDRAIALGHSALGLIALEYARHYPEHVSHVVMIGSPPSPLVESDGAALDFVPEVKAFWEEDASAERKELLPVTQAELTEERMATVPPGKAFGVWYIAHRPMVFFDPRYDAAWMFDPIEFDSPTFTHFLGVILEDYDVGTTLRELTAPVFLALGRYDYLVPHVTWDPWKDVVPGLTCRVFDESGHYPMMEEPEGFDRALLEWLKDN
jgi:proline iminopeptidase